jgi:hypothetical protein
MATKARHGGPPEAPPGERRGTGLSEADIPTPPAGVFAQAAAQAPPVPEVADEVGPGVNETGSDRLKQQYSQDAGGPARSPVTQQVISSTPSVSPPAAQTAAAAPDAGAEEWEEVGTAAWDPAAVWDAEDKNELWVKGLGWGAPPETPRWQGQHASTTGPAVRVGWSAAGWSSDPPRGLGDQPDAGRSWDEAAPASTDDFTVAHPRLPDGDDVDARAADDDREDRDGVPLPQAHRALPWRELVTISAVAVIAAAVFLGVTTPKFHLANSGTPASPPSSAAAGASGLASSTGRAGSTGNAGSAGHAGRTGSAGATGAQTSTPPAHTSSPTSAPSGRAPATTAALLNERAKALPVTPGVEESLIKSWVATNPGGYGLSLADVAGTVPSEAYYAVQPATGTYWAVAAFKPSAALLAQSSTTTGKAELSEFKNSVYAFSWQAGPVWTLLGEVSTGDCPGIWVPPTVLAAWGLCGL